MIYSTVYPWRDPCREARLGLKAGRAVAAGLLMGENPVERAGPGIEFMDYREYMYGDDIRHVDWRVSARLGAAQGKLYLRVYRAERRARIVWLVDLSSSMGYLWKPRAAAFLLGLASTISSRLGDTVEPILVSSRVEVYPPMSPQVAAWLAVKRICGHGLHGRLGPGDAAEKAAAVSRGKTLVAFTDYASQPRGYRLLRRAVEAAGGWAAAFIVATGGERGEVPPGTVYLYNPEGGGVGPVSLEEYSRRARTHVILVKEALGRGRFYEARAPGGRRVAVEAALAYAGWRCRMPSGAT